MALPKAFKYKIIFSRVASGYFVVVRGQKVIMDVLK